MGRRAASARKRRTPTGVEHLGLVGSPGSRALIVDDILDTGDTLVSCCRQLRDAGVKQLGVIATHGLFTGERWRALCSEQRVREIWITDTVPPAAGTHRARRTTASTGARRNQRLRRL
jgi:ribose-phosphate pyrophosphokinase